MILELFKLFLSLHDSHHLRHFTVNYLPDGSLGVQIEFIPKGK